MENKKNFLLGMLIIVLALGITVVGCDNDPEGDTWSKITSLSQLDGTWKGSYSDTATQDGITAKTTITVILTINASAKTTSGSMTATLVFSGTEIAAAWPSIKSSFAGDPGVTIDDSTYTITVIETINEVPISDADIEELLASGIRISQDGKKIKMPAEGDMPEIIMTKQ